MQAYKRESERLKNTTSDVEKAFPRLGVNKKQEIIRLLYEISKKENTLPSSIIKDIDSIDFDTVKQRLLRRRFPSSYINNETTKPHLPKLKLDKKSCLDIENKTFYPKNVFVEKAAQRSQLTERFRKSFPEATFSEIKSLKDYLKTHRNTTVSDYNKRRDSAFITYENYDFFKACPCTKKAVGCGYNIFNLSFGCIFECTFCYLQEYTNSPGIIFPANIDNFFREFSSYKRKGMHIGTGEFSDSLMLDNITEYSLPIVEFFRKHPDVLFEFKTKSVNIENLLKIDHSGNIVIAWSLNPQRIIDENEFLSTSLLQRISAAKKCSQAGYKLAFHFDPVIYFDGWKKEYKKVVDLIFSSVRPDDIAWISIGTLRFNPKVKQVIEDRFPGNKILDQELLPGFDNKLRYPAALRQNIYKAMFEMLSRHSKKLPIYLCMESPSMWKEAGLRPKKIC